jgi:recombination protein RecA
MTTTKKKTGKKRSAKKVAKEKSLARDFDGEACVDRSSVAFFLDTQADCFPTGSTMLNLTLGGGWPLRRVFNIVGDRSTGKSLLAIEACSEFLAYHNGNARVVYIETEAAFDEPYAQALGMPIEKIRFLCKEADILTIEDLDSALQTIIDEADGTPTLVIVDSYDALASAKELDRKEGETKGFGTEKAKASSELFRTKNKKLHRANVTLGIVSQVRENIGALFGDKVTRSGGKALNFYATHIVMLQHMGRLTKTKQRITRVFGVKIRAKIDKNKISMPFREVEFPIIFGYGIENVVSMVDWLQKNNGISEAFNSEAEAAAFLKGLESMNQAEYREAEKDISAAVTDHWRYVEELFLPTRTKRGV